MHAWVQASPVPWRDAVTTYAGVREGDFRPRNVAGSVDSHLMTPWMYSHAATAEKGSRIKRIRADAAKIGVIE
jgi:hypothetical protein